MQKTPEDSDVEKLLRRWIRRGAELRALRAGVRKDLERQALKAANEILRSPDFSCSGREQ